MAPADRRQLKRRYRTKSLLSMKGALRSRIRPLLAARLMHCPASGRGDYRLFSG